MIELTEIEKEFLDALKPKNFNEWFYPTNNNSKEFDLAESLLNKGLLERHSVPVMKDNSFCGLKHHYRLFDKNRIKF